MGQQEKLPLGGTVTVAGTKTEQLRVGGFGTVGISGVDAVVSDQVARSLGIPAGNAIVISAPSARLSTLMHEVAQVLPKDASVAPLVAQAAERGLPVSTGSAGAINISAASGPGLRTICCRARNGAAAGGGGASPTPARNSNIKRCRQGRTARSRPRAAPAKPRRPTT